MELRQRLDYVDVFRGIALFIMVVIQIFDYLSVSNIYTTPPYYVEAINSVTWVPPSLLFTFVSGMSVFLLVKKRLKVNEVSGKKAFFEIFRKYGKYVLISLPFTAIMWSFSTYVWWEEAIQGIGLTAIFTALFLVIWFKYEDDITSNRSQLFLVSLIALFAFLQFLVPNLLEGSFLSSLFPQQPDLGNTSVFSFMGSVLFNALFRGWFSVANLFPIMLGGVLLIGFMKSGVKHKKLLVLSVIPLVLSVLLHLFGFHIDYYNRSFALTFFAVGQSALICSIFYGLYRRIKSKNLSKVWEVLKVFGTTAFFVYVSHYLLVLKVLEVASLKDHLSDPYAWAITVPLVAFIYFLAKGYSKIRPRLPRILRL